MVQAYQDHLPHPPSPHIVMDILFSSSMFGEFALLAQMNAVIVTPDNVDRFRCARQLRANLRVDGRLKGCRAVLNAIFW